MTDGAPGRTSKERNRLKDVFELGGLLVSLGVAFALDVGLVDEDDVCRVFDRLEPLERLGQLAP